MTTTAFTYPLLLLLSAVPASIPYGNINSGNNMSNIHMNEPGHPVVPAESNPLLAKWGGPYGGVPAFDLIKVNHFRPALRSAMAEKLQETEKIATDTTAATFQNTIAAMEVAGHTLKQVLDIYGIWENSMNGPEFQVVQREMGPVIAGFADKIYQNDKLFKRIEAVYKVREKSRLTKEQQRLTWLYYNNFVRAGAKLNAGDKQRLSAINQKLAVSFTRFSQNLLGDESELFVVLKNQDDLKGLPESLKESAAAEAVAKKLPGSWIISNTRSSVDPFLTYSTRRDLREKVYNMFINRGDNGGPLAMPHMHTGALKMPWPTLREMLCN